MDATFIETLLFTRRIVALGLEESLKELQARLLESPDLGDIDPGSGGLRKVRMPDPARGKGTRSGARVHYLLVPHIALIYLVFVYTKGEDDTLTRQQKKALASGVRQIKQEYRKGQPGEGE